MKANLVLLGIAVILIILGMIKMLTFADNISAAMFNGFIYGIIFASVVNIIVLKIKTKK